MNREQAAASLAAYWSQVIEAEKLPRLTGRRKDALADLNKQLPAINEILRWLAPDLLPISAQWIADHVRAGPTVHRATRIIMDWRVMDSHCQPDGSPVFALNLLDQVIAEAALPLWGSGKYRQAVNDAATGLNKFAQDRLGRHDVYDLKLMNEAFSDESPKLGKPRLRCPGDHQLLEIRDQQNGARQLAAAAFLAIRNPAHHMTGDWNPVTAFHHLTILSQVAHYFRYWEVMKYVFPAPDTTAVLAAYQAQMTKPALASPQARSAPADAAPTSSS